MKDIINQRLYEHQCYVVEQLHNRGLILGRDYHIEGVYLQGSQNYNVHTDKSDVDSKMVVLPTIRSLIRDTKLTVDMDVPCEDGSVEKCSVKPYKDFEALFFKGNFNNLEILFTEYRIGGCEFTEILRNRREELVKKIWPGLVSACLGMQNQKKAGLYKFTEGTKEFFDEHGYDNKNLIHILRIADTVNRYPYCANFAESLKISGSTKEEINLIRAGKVGKDSVDFMVDSAMRVVETVRSDLSEFKAMDKMHKELPILKDEIGEITANLLEDFLMWTHNES